MPVVKPPISSMSPEDLPEALAKHLLLSQRVDDNQVEFPLCSKEQASPQPSLLKADLLASPANSG